MARFFGVAVEGLLRTCIFVVLALLVAFDLVGLLLLAIGALVGMDVHVNGGPLTVILGVAFLVVCLMGMRAMLRPRSH